MAILYPLALPTVTGIRNVDIRAVNAVAYSASPFTFAGQTHAYPGQMWQAEISLPAMNRSKAETWISFLLSLRGQFGTFLLGDPRACSPRGLANIFPGLPKVSGAGQTGGTLAITGASTSKTDWLLAGDYIQLGTGATSTLHKVLQNVTTDASGNASLEIWPYLRSSPANNAAITLQDTQGVFRLSSNEQGWSSNELAKYGITFAAREAI